MGCQLFALVVAMSCVATMASMASMVWMAQGSTDVGVPLVPMMVATNGGVGGWRRWMASMVGVDGWRRWWTGVVDTEGADVEVPLYSPVVRTARTAVACSSSDSLQDISGFCPCWPAACVSFSQSSFSFVMVVYSMTVILTAELWCL